MCLLFGTFPQKELKIKIEDRAGNLIETPKSEGKVKRNVQKGEDQDLFIYVSEYDTKF